MYALPHHVMAMELATPGWKLNPELGPCIPTIRGDACPVVGGDWELAFELPDNSFTSKLPIASGFHRYSCGWGVYCYDFLLLPITSYYFLLLPIASCCFLLLPACPTRVQTL